MARNTNIQSILFPVKLKPIYLKYDIYPVKGFNAVVGTFSNPDSTIANEQVISIVTTNYLLVSNEKALEIGQDIHNKLFPNATSSSFEIFNIKTPKTLGSCHIDIIDKNYKLNILKREVYVPFVRIQNSYNKTMPLRYQVGFCRSLCNNGVIFEENTISINLQHTYRQFNSFSFDAIDTKWLHKFEADFISKTNKADKIHIPEKVFLPLAAKALNLKFNLDDNNNDKLQSELESFDKFKFIMMDFADRYIRKEQLGETAYAFFNAITDYASNFPHRQARTSHDMQNRCGKWLSEFCQRQHGRHIDWKVELRGCEQLVK